ncbi:hypothetical protein FRB99_000517 [Tulasnella sp. 403]|nr:hypothetical protein FRB99_000517 [Tulasnella sp. 403]
MHQLLTIPDILIQIFGSDGVDLKMVGSVCSIWREIAVDIEWASARLRALLRLLGPLTEVPAPDYGLCVKVRPNYEDLPERDRDLFLRRARRVAHIKNCDFYLHPKTVDLIRRLAKEHDPLFPCLTTLSIDIIANVEPTVSVLFGPSLRYLDIHVGRGLRPHTWEGVFQSIVTHSGQPFVQNLIMTADWAEPPLRAPTLTDLRRLSLEECRINLNVWTTISSLPRLKDLIIRNADMSLPQAYPKSFVFPALEKLDLGPNRGTRTATIIQSSPMPVLQSFKIFDIKVLAEDLQTIADVLKERSPLIETLQISCGELTVERLRPFMELHNLRNYHILGKLDDRASDVDFKSLAKTMACLEHLEISWTAGMDSSRHLTPSSLVALAEYATSLRSLEITVNCENFQLEDYPNLPRFKALKSLRITISSSADLDPVPFAQFLQELCPNLSTMIALKTRYRWNPWNPSRWEQLSNQYWQGKANDQRRDDECLALDPLERRRTRPHVGAMSSGRIVEQRNQAP